MAEGGNLVCHMAEKYTKKVKLFKKVQNFINLKKQFNFNFIKFLEIHEISKFHKISKFSKILKFQKFQNKFIKFLKF